MSKKNFQIFALILLFYYGSVKCFPFELQPININYYGVETKNDTIAVYGDYGSLILSNDNAETWRQIKVFETGTIIRLFFENNRIIAFNNFGKVGISSNSGKNWDTLTIFQDTILTVIKVNNKYLVRLDDKLVLLSDSLKVTKANILRSNFSGGADTKSYIHTLTEFKDKFIVSMPLMILYIFDKELKLLDSVKLKDFDFCISCNSITRTFSNKSYLFLNGTYNISRTTDLKQFEKIYETTESVTKYGLFDGNIFYPSLYTKIKFELHKINYPLENEIVANYNGKEITSNITINDFIIKNNKLIFVGNNKFIAISDLSNNSFRIISDFSGISLHSFPDAINDSTFLFYNGYYSPNQNYGLYYPMLYKTDNHGLTFKSTVDPIANPNFKSFGFFDYKYFNSENNSVYFGGWDKYHYDTGGFLVSDDYGKNFTFKPVKNTYIKSIVIPNLQKNNNGFVMALNSIMNFKDYVTIYTLSSNFDIITYFLDSNFVFKYNNSIDTNTFLVLGKNSLENINEIKYTSNRGLNWEIIHKYNKYDSLLYYQEYDYQGNKYLFMCFYNIQDSTLRFEALNIEDKSLQTIFTYKKNLKIDDLLINTAFYSDGKIFYLSVKDTLFYIDDLKAMNPKKHLILPNNGRITRTFKKYGGKFCVRYSDDINPENLYWLKLPDKIEIKPQILADDFDFGKFDIKETNFKSIKIKITNPSEESNLIISEYTNSNGTSFKHNLPTIDLQNPIIIKPSEFFEYTVTFKPTKVGLFKDSIIFKSNADEFDPKSLFEGEAIDTLISSVDIDIETQNYLYAYPPYPLPAVNEVRSLIYWDTSTDIENDEMTVYNIYGTKVAGKEKLRIDKLTNYSGNLVWDCSEVPSGIYLININHGTESRAVKVIVNK